MGYRSSDAPRLVEQFSRWALNPGVTLLSRRHRHPPDRSFPDAAEIEHAFVLDYVGDLREALGRRVL
jgi:hypothetical protein